MKEKEKALTAYGKQYKGRYSTCGKCDHKPMNKKIKIEKNK